MRGARSYPGESTTTNNVRTAVWDTKHRKSSRRRRQPASTQLSERQGTQTPSLAPRAPPSRLQPRMEKQKAVVFLRERIWGAGQSNHDFKPVTLQSFVQHQTNRLVILDDQDSVCCHEQ